MKTIEITTAQKVEIRYELASWLNRVLAFLIDAIILWISLSMLFSLLIAVSSSALQMTIGYLVVVPLYVFYTLACETFFNGQTIGKRAIGIRVVKLDGKAATTSDYLMRWVFRGLDIYGSAGFIGSMLILSSEKGQRLGGLTSNTVVVKSKGGSQFNLDDILRIQTLNNYEPQYPQVRRFSENDMLNVKLAIQRYSDHPNTAHKELLIELVDQVSEKMGIEAPRKGKMGFLKTLIKDYIVLTR